MVAFTSSDTVSNENCITGGYYPSRCTGMDMSSGTGLYDSNQQNHLNSFCSSNTTELDCLSTSGSNTGMCVWQPCNCDEIHLVEEFL